MAKKLYARCATSCSPATKYPSAFEALEHLHTEHFDCPLGELAAGRTKDKLHDDPCYAYIEALSGTPSNEAEINSIANEFINHISDFSGTLNKIQWLIATNSPGTAERRRPGPHSRQPPQPQLPRSLVNAFDGLVAYYTLQAKRLSLQNRGIGLNARNAVEDSSQALARSASLAIHCRNARDRVQGYLQQAAPRRSGPPAPTAPVP
jgi:hypothetical protein